MKRTMFFYVAIMSCLVASGCTSLNGSITSNTNPRTGEPLYYDQLAKQYSSPAQMMGKATVQDIQLAFNQRQYQEVYPDASFQAKFTPTEAGAKIDFSWTSPRALFPPSAYDLAALSTQSYNKREALAFVDIVGEGLRKLLAKLNDAGMKDNYTILAQYEGVADNAPIVTRIVYRGEYGRVTMSSSNTRYNGRPQAFQIDPGQQIQSNGELAALRAYGLYSYLHGKLKNLGVNQDRVQDQFEVKAVNSRGREHRTAKVTITILDN